MSALQTPSPLLIRTALVSRRPPRVSTPAAALSLEVSPRASRDATGLAIACGLGGVLLGVLGGVVIAGYVNRQVVLPPTPTEPRPRPLPAMAVLPEPPKPPVTVERFPKPIATGRVPAPKLRLEASWVGHDHPLAEAYCGQRSGMAGVPWRLPSVDELLQLLDDGALGPYVYWSASASPDAPKRRALGLDVVRRKIVSLPRSRTSPRTACVWGSLSSPVVPASL